MLKHEFENLVGQEVSNEIYEKVEAVYMSVLFEDMFPNKQAIANCYKQNGMESINCLYEVDKRFWQLIAEKINLKKENEKLQALLNGVQVKAEAYRKDLVAIRDIVMKK